MNLAMSNDTGRSHVVRTAYIKACHYQNSIINHIKIHSVAICTTIISAINEVDLWY